MIDRRPLSVANVNVGKVGGHHPGPTPMQTLFPTKGSKPEQRGNETEMMERLSVMAFHPSHLLILIHQVHHQLETSEEETHSDDGLVSTFDRIVATKEFAWELNLM